MLSWSRVVKEVPCNWVADANDAVRIRFTACFSERLAVSGSGVRRCDERMFSMRFSVISEKFLSDVFVILWTMFGI